MSLGGEIPIKTHKIGWWQVALLGLAGFVSCTARAEVVIVAPERVLTLDQALDIALQRNRSLENADMEVDKAADSVKAARTRQLPRLDLNLSESYNLTPQSYT